MLTTDDIFNLNDSSLKSSCNFNQIQQIQDGDSLSDEDFLQQLSSELDIPLLLNQEEFNVNSELLSGVIKNEPNFAEDFSFLDLKFENLLPSSPESLSQSSDEFLSTYVNNDICQNVPNDICQTYIKNDNSDFNTESLFEKLDTPPRSPEEKKFSETQNFKNKIPKIHKSQSAIKKIEKKSIRQVPIKPKIIENISNDICQKSDILTCQINPLNTNVKNGICQNTAVNVKNGICQNQNSVTVNVKNGICQSQTPVNVKNDICQNIPVKMSIIPKNNVVIINPSQNINQILPNFPNISPQLSNCPVDTKFLKRQQRMIKNRESACLSRKKKKDYLTNLENENVKLKEECQKLKEENFQLKQKLLDKNCQCQGTKSDFLKLPHSKTLKKNSVFLFAVLFMVSVNFGTIKGLFSLSQKSDLFQSTNSLGRHSRNLLWIPENLEENVENLSIKNLNTTSNLCSNKQYVNQSESVRLAQELHRWIAKPYFNQTFTKKSTKNRKRRKIYLKDDFPATKLKFSLYRRNFMRFPKEYRNNEIEIFKPKPDILYSDFFDAINRRDDTFYIVSLYSDNLLLPALNHNYTRRPKMSLLLPALVANESSSTVSLMQIDCEVLNTHLLHVKSTKIPDSLRNTLNVTRKNFDNKDQFNFEHKYQDDNLTNKNFDKKYFTPYFIKNVTNIKLGKK